MPDKHNSDLGIEVLVGFFMFIILIALGIFTIVLSRQNFLQKKYPVQVLFEEVGGLREGDNVYLRGTKVGVVKATTLENNHVSVRADLDVPVSFRKGYKVEVADSSMLGGKMLKLYEGPLNAEPVAKDTVIIGTPPINILGELGVAVDGIKTLIAQIANGEGTLGKLISDDTIYNDVQSITADLKKVSRGLADGEGTLGKLLTDDELYATLNGTMTNLYAVSERLAGGKGTLGKLLSEDDELYQNLSSSVADIREITGKIGSGEGTLGKLVTDDQMYNEAQKLLEELRAALDDMRETSPVTTFSTIFFGAF
ncbi:MAG: MlaD family protein [Kiritimatiellales bacterium]